MRLEIKFTDTDITIATSLCTVFCVMEHFLQENFTRNTNFQFL